MAHVPDDFITGAVKDVVKRQSQFHNTQAGRQVPAGHADVVDDVITQFGSQLG